jgi:NADP-dependent alcohol dehydrogenase
MNNFELYNPTRLVFGVGQMSKLSELIPENQIILLAYGGGSIFKNGIYNQLKKALEGRTVVEFGGIEANPRYETLLKGIDLIKQHQITFILAVGGGSVIDGVKFMSAAVYYPGDPIELLHKKPTVLKTALPFGTVLTLPATGSEMNSGAVVTIDATKEKLSFGSPFVFPKFSICDPTVIQSLPKRQLQNGVIDAYTHVLEQYLTYPHSGFLQDKFAESILQTLLQIGPEVIGNPANYELASNFMWCCTMALNGLIQKGVPTDWATHMIGHELTAMYDIDHARTLAIIGPNLYRVMFETKKEKLAQYGQRIFQLSGGADHIAMEAINKTEAFFHALGVQTKLSDYTDTYHDSAELIAERFEKRGWTAIGERQNITPKKVHEIVVMSY